MMNKGLYVHSEERQERFCRSLDSLSNGAKTNPYKLLATAIIAQAAVDCSLYEPEDPKAEFKKSSDRRFLTFEALRSFINSDWIDALLSWQNDITPEAVCEELARRIESAQYKAAKLSYQAFMG